jgi:hypothetical protein
MGVPKEVVGQCSRKLSIKKTAEEQDAASYLLAVYCTFGFMLFHARLKRRVTLYSQCSPSILRTRS